MLGCSPSIVFPTVAHRSAPFPIGGERRSMAARCGRCFPRRRGKRAAPKRAVRLPEAKTVRHRAQHAGPPNRLAVPRSMSAGSRIDRDGVTVKSRRARSERCHATKTTERDGARPNTWSHAASSLECSSATSTHVRVRCRRITPGRAWSVSAARRWRCPIALFTRSRSRNIRHDPSSLQRPRQPARNTDRVAIVWPTKLCRSIGGLTPSVVSRPKPRRTGRLTILFGPLIHDPPRRVTSTRGRGRCDGSRAGDGAGRAAATFRA